MPLALPRRRFSTYLFLVAAVLVAPGARAFSEAPDTDNDDPLVPAEATATACDGAWALPPPGLPQLPLPPTTELANALDAFPASLDRATLVEQIRQATSSTALAETLGSDNADAHALALVHVALTESTFGLHSIKIALQGAGEVAPEDGEPLLAKAREHLDELIERLSDNTIEPTSEVPDETTAAVYESLRSHLDRSIIRGIGVPATPSGEAVLLEELYSNDHGNRRLAIAGLAAQPGFPHFEAVDLMLAGIDDAPTENWLAQAAGIAGS